MTHASRALQSYDLSGEGIGCGLHIARYSGKQSLISSTSMTDKRGNDYSKQKTSNVTIAQHFHTIESRREQWIKDFFITIGALT